MVLTQPGTRLVLRDMPDPNPTPGKIRISVAACGVCRTDLHVVDGELPTPKLPPIPGHEIVGHVDAIGPGWPIVDIQIAFVTADGTKFQR